jgi:hypothetical protein
MTSQPNPWWLVAFYLLLAAFVSTEYPVVGGIIALVTVIAMVLVANQNT